jgi:3',5'-cyclic AMP phosphodiesterase CpdA
LHITVLNSWDEARGKNTRQMQWLNTDLQAATRQTDLVDFIIVMFHHAPYSRGARV